MFTKSVLLSGTPVASLIDCPEALEALYQTVTENITPNSLPDLADLKVKKSEEESRKKLDKKLPKEAKPRSKGQMLPSSSNHLNNWFALLCSGIDSSDSEEDKM